MPRPSCVQRQLVSPNHFCLLAPTLLLALVAVIIIVFKLFPSVQMTPDGPCENGGQLIH